MFWPVIKENECTNCRACQRICPKMVFDLEDRKVTVAMPTYCTGCESCSEVCPLKAIDVREI
ncbi:MAG: 4Fe-4S binding protein [Desulfomonile tiedjei]|nr:4Fe-4S binding protein [Desulfomonile tiedjei]